MHIHTKFVLPAILAAALTAAAHADTYSFLITTPGSIFSGTGTLTGTPDPSNSSAIELTSVTGGAQGYIFSSIVPVGSNPNFTYDNLLYTAPNAPHVDSEGILLELAIPNIDATSLVHIYEAGGQYEAAVLDPGDPTDVTPFTLDTFSLTPSVPEPSTLALLGTGIVGAIGAFRRRLSA